MQTETRFPERRRPGTVLLAVLVVIVVLSLAAYKYGELMSSELRATNRILKTAQVKAFAESGVQYAAALLANADSITNNLDGNTYDNPTMFQDIAMQQDGSRSGMFSIVTPDYSTLDQNATGTVPIVHGVVDESGKININAVMQLDSSGTVLVAMLMNLPNMTSDIANAIADWVDTDDTTRTGGAESDYYEALSPPYSAKNGPLDSLEELLLVKGVTPALLYGNDLGKNGQIDPRSADSEGSIDAGWIPYLTIYSRETNVDSTGTQRLYLNASTVQDTYTQLQTLVGNPTAAYIMAYRLFDVSAASTAAASTAAPSALLSASMQANVSATNAKTAKGGSTSSGSSSSASGGGGGGGGGTTTKVGTTTQLVSAVETCLAAGGQPKRSISSIFSLIGSSVSQSTITNTVTNGKTTTTTVTTVFPFPLTDASSLQTTLPIVLDKTTIKGTLEIPARININTAPQSVLLALPGLTATDVEAILAARPAVGTLSPDPSFATPAWLATKVTLSSAVLQGLEKYVTTSSQVYRFQSVGYFDQGGPVYRIEAVVDGNQGSPRIVYYRDLTDLGRTLDPRQLSGSSTGSGGSGGSGN